MKFLITGKRDKFWKAVGAAYSEQLGVRATVMPIGSPVIATVRGTPLDAILYTLSSKEEIKLLRWIHQIKPTLPVIALVPVEDDRLRKAILEEGVDEVLVVSSFEPGEIQKSILSSRLLALGSEKVSSDARQQNSDGWHTIRVTPTAGLADESKSERGSERLPGIGAKVVLATVRGVITGRLVAWSERGARIRAEGTGLVGTHVILRAAGPDKVLEKKAVVLWINSEPNIAMEFDPENKGQENATNLAPRLIQFLRRTFSP